MCINIHLQLKVYIYIVCSERVTLKIVVKCLNVFYNQSFVRVSIFSLFTIFYFGDVTTEMNFYPILCEHFKREKYVSFKICFCYGQPPLTQVPVVDFGYAVFLALSMKVAVGFFAFALFNSFILYFSNRAMHKNKNNKLFTIYTRYKEKGEKVTNQENIHDNC